MKRILIAVILFLALASFATAGSFNHHTFTATTTANESPTKSSTGESDQGTCFVSNSTGTFELDIQGSIDGSNFFDLISNETTTGAKIWALQPTTHIRIDVTSCTGGSGTDCGLTVNCVTGGR